MSSGVPTDPKAASTASRSPTSTRKSPVRSKQSDLSLREARGGDKGQLSVRHVLGQGLACECQVGADSCAWDRSASSARHAAFRRINALALRQRQQYAVLDLVLHTS